jgi:methionyl-tRNA formyltransferase
MRPEIDAGEIILQQEVPIRPGQSQHELMLQCKRVGADLLAETLHGFRTDTVTTEPNPADASSYFSFPTADDGRRFREAGCQWF